MNYIATKITNLEQKITKLEEEQVALKGEKTTVNENISTWSAALADENGWAFLGELGNLMLKKKPDFDPRNYGYSKMLPLIKSMNQFEIDERETGKKNIKHIYIKKIRSNKYE